jgi:type I restriction enzyme S subunit
MKRYSKYKDSGIEWIGEIPEHWDCYNLRYVLRENVKDGPHETPIWVENGIPFLSIDGIVNGELSFDNCRYIDEEHYAKYTKKLVIEENDIFIGKAASIGKIARVKTALKFTVWSPIAVIKVAKQYSPIYFEYLFKSDLIQYQIEILSTSNTQKNIAMGDIPKIKITIPPLPEQTAIATYLDRKTAQIEDLISKKEKLIELLKEERTAMINQAVTKGLDPNVPMKDSGIEWLGEIPEGWEVKPLKHICNIQGRVGYKGYTISDLVEKGEGPYTLGAKHINKMNQLDLSQPEFISWEKYYESPEIMVFQNDLLLTQRGTLGKVVLIEENIGEATINPSMVLLNKLKANGKFLYYFFCSEYFTKWIDLTNTATAVPMISQQQLGNFKLTIPPEREQISIIEYLYEKQQIFNELTLRISNQVALLKEYKTALISEVVTGKLKVIED